MKEQVTKNWTNNLGMKLLSLPLAFIIWIIIINIDDPTISRTFPNVAIELQNTDAIASLGKVYEIAEGNTVTVTVTGRRSILDKIRSSDLKVTADLKQMSAFNLLDMEVSCDKYAYADLSFSTKPKMLTVSLENKTTKQFKVNVETTGSVDENYYVGSMDVDPKMVEVSGAESVVERIADIRITVPLNDETESFKLTKLVPKAYDESGKEIDSSKLEFSDTSVTVEINVQGTKVVPVQVTTTGLPATGFGVLQTDFDPRQVKITGSREVLEQITAIPVEIDISNARSTIEREIILTEYLPEGVVIVGNTNSIAVKVTIEQMISKEYTFTASDIEILNVPEGLHIAYNNTNRLYKVTVMGMEADLDILSMENLGAYIDLANLTEGTHLLAIKFNIQGNYVITNNPMISIQLLGENTSDNPENNDDENSSEIGNEGENIGNEENVGNQENEETDVTEPEDEIITPDNEE